MSITLSERRLQKPYRYHHGASPVKFTKTQYARMDATTAGTIVTSLVPQPRRDPITCHVLDLTTGRPAPNIAVSLTLLRPLGPSNPFRAITTLDGRVSIWDAQEGPSLSDIFANLAEHEDGKMVWSLRFETGAYYGEGNTFFPEVEVKFFVYPHSGHYHIPLLLGPWSYTTYRGS